MIFFGEELGMKRLVGLSFASLCVAIAANGAVINASSCSNTSVQSAINSAASGDTVAVPTGNCTWTSTVTISGKAITLQGAGIGQTNVNDSTPGAALNITASSTNFVRVTGFTFIKSANNSNGMVQIGGTSTFTGQVAFRFDHNRIAMASSGARGITPVGVYGYRPHHI